MDKDVKSLITFRRLNLMEPWPFNGKFDAIFCRNVMIYFDAPTKSTLVERFTQQLKPGGWLYHRPFGIADRLASRAAAGRPHDLPEERHEHRIGTEASRPIRGAPKLRRRRRRRRFFDTTHAAWMVKVFPGEFYVTRQAGRDPGHRARLMRVGLHPRSASSASAA